MTKCEAAAKWWADCLRGPALQDNGDLRQTLFASVIASRLFKPRPEEQIQKFQELLQKKLETGSFVAEWDVRTSHDGVLIIGVDYHAPRLLMDTLEEAGH